MRVIGLMSGTSHDAIQAAAADLRLADGELLLRPLGALGVPYPEQVRADIAEALPPAATDLETVCRIDTGVGRAFAAAAARADDELCAGTAELVVSHGQTVFHWVRDGQVHGSLQLGQPAWIAERTGLPVVSDLRNRDIAAGGQGAPLVGLFDSLLLRGRPGVPAALNLGGIANITVTAPGRPVLAYDTGPANALIDAAVRHFSGGERDYDEDGRAAGRGHVLPDLLQRLLADPYYRLPPPKSTGKEHFHLPYLLDALAGLPEPGPDDVIATLTALTALTVAAACREHGVTELAVSGGGARNPVLMEMLDEAAPETRLLRSDDLGVPSDAKEAYAFAVLGYLTVHGLPGSVPSCTGAERPSVLGRITPGREPLRLPGTPAAAPRVLRIGPAERPGG